MWVHYIVVAGRWWLAFIENVLHRILCSFVRVRATFWTLSFIIFWTMFFFFFFNFHNNDTPNTQLVIFYSNRNRSESRIWEKSLKAKILSRRVNDLSVRWNNVFMKNQLFRKPTVRGVSAFALISQCFCDAIMNNNSYYTDNTTRYESIISVRPDFIYHVTAVTSNYLVV